jgi:hypothetical protein
MEDKDKKRDPMPPPDATPEEIGEFWDTHSLADYWDETHEVEFQVNLKSRQDLSPDETEAVDQRDALSVEQGWQKLKDLIQSIKPADFEKLAATLLTSFLEVPFVVARSGDQPSGDARSLTGEVSIQAKKYTGKNSPNAKIIEGDIRQAIRTLQNLQVYILAVSRDTAQLRDTLDAVEEETGLDIVVLELTNNLSDLGALCVTLWEDIRGFLDSSDIYQDQNFLAWVEERKDDSETKEKIKELQLKLEHGLQTQNHIQNKTKEYLLKRFSTDKGFNPINLSQAIDRESVESKITDWWETQKSPICYLEGKEGHGKTWLASKWMNSFREKENIVTFWLDSKDWRGDRSIFDLLRTCFRLIYPSYEQGKITKLQNKSAKIWRKTLIVLDGVNERNAIEAAQWIFTEYFRNDEDESQWRDRVRFLLTTRPLDDYPDFESYLWSECHKISVDRFNDSELQEALILKGLQLDDLPDSLIDTARIPRYFQTCIRLRNQFRSFEAVTKEMVLWADLLDKIERTDPQIKQKLGWHGAKDAQEILSDLAKQVKWTNVDSGPQASVQLLEKYFPDYREVRHDLEEQRIATEAGLLHVKLSEDHITLGWSLYLANLFECREFTGIKDFAESFQNALEPIPSEDLRTKALFVALQITAISLNPEISQDQLSQKRAALMLAWFNSHNAQITGERLSFWAEKDPDAYAQVVEFEFEHHNSPNYEDGLIAPLAKTWLNKKGDLSRLASRLTKWFFSSDADSVTEDIDAEREEDSFPTMYYTRNRLSAAALSILSQRPERQLLATLARCHENSEGKVQFRDDIGRLMRWGYSEEVLGNLHWLAELAQHNERLLDGIYGLAANLALVDLPPLLQRPLSKKELETRAFVEQSNSRFKSPINHIRDGEKLLTGKSPSDNVKGNHHGLGYLAVRTDLPDLRDEDLVKIKKVLHHISKNAKLGQSAGMTLEDSCINNLLPWVAKYDPESYAELACDLKINTLNQKWAQFKLRSIHGLIFKPEDYEKITEAILGMKQRLVQDIQTDNSSSDAIHLTSLLTETLLFCASEERLIEWFEFLSSHEPLRISICRKPLPRLLTELLPETVVKLVQQKLEKLWPSPSDDQTGSSDESKEFPEEEFWCRLYTYGAPINEKTVKYALEELKRRDPDSTGTFPMLWLALSRPNQFLAGTLNDKKIRRHLFSRNGRKFIIPIYEGENIPSYDTLMSSLPPEIVGAFLCRPDQRADLSQWGKELIKWLCSILQGAKVDFDYDREMRFLVNSKVLQTWAEQNTNDFRQLANEYLTELSKSPRYGQTLSDFTDNVRCLLLRFQPDKAKQYYHQWNSESFKTVYRTHYGVEASLAQLWKVEYCKSPEHRQFRRELFEECLNDEEIMFMTLAALAGGGEKELWDLVEKKYLEHHRAKERNLGVSILPWFGTCEAINELKRLKSSDQSQWVREHAAWAYEVAQQERSCKEVYREALQTRDLFRISAVFEQMKPALSPTAQWWHREVEKKEFGEEPQDLDPKLVALVDRFWYRWGNSTKTKRNIEVFRRKLNDYCRGEKLSAGSTPRIAPWWKPTFDTDG